MTCYYAAHSERSLEEICSRLQDSLAVPGFAIRNELPNLYAERGGWTWASASSDALSLRVTRTEELPAADAWMPGQPGGANTLIALTADAAPAESGEILTEALGGAVLRYAKVDSVWTVAQEVEQHYRWVRQSSCLGGFAIFTLRLSPTLDVSGVRFSDVVDYDRIERRFDIEPKHARFYAGAVEEGVDACVQHWMMAGRPLGHLEVALTEIVIHPVDSTARHFRLGGARAMEQALEEHALVL